MFKKKYLSHIPYDADIKKVKDSLPKLYVDIARLKSDFKPDEQFKIVSIDKFMEYMAPYIVEAGCALKMPPQFGHVGYNMWKEWFDINGDAIMETKTFQNTLRKYLINPYRKHNQSWLNFKLEQFKFYAKKLVPFLCVLLISSNSFAQVSLIQKDQPAPYTGYLFSLKSEQENKIQLLQGDFYKEQHNLDQEIMNIQKEKIKELDLQVGMWKVQVDDLSLRLSKQEDNNFLKSTLYFLAGAVLTGVIVFGVNKASK
jgi:hypothetical protein